MDKSQQFRFANFEISHKTGISNKVKLGSNEQFRKTDKSDTDALWYKFVGLKLGDLEKRYILLHFLRSFFKPELVKIEYDSLFNSEFHEFRS